mmetsp:Transcript_35872/g.93994  ORF Transcript_35872/g.93994 Transcript_35872/m.93994 type:complete len:305 (+) Transcript_35872:1875-2789(+)
MEPPCFIVLFGGSGEDTHQVIVYKAVKFVKLLFHLGDNRARPRMPVCESERVGVGLLFVLEGVFLFGLLRLRVGQEHIFRNAIICSILRCLTCKLCVVDNERPRVDFKRELVIFVLIVQVAVPLLQVFLHLNVRNRCDIGQRHLRGVWVVRVPLSDCIELHHLKAILHRLRHVVKRTVWAGRMEVVGSGRKFRFACQPLFEGMEPGNIVFVFVLWWAVVLAWILFEPDRLGEETVVVTVFWHLIGWVESEGVLHLDLLCPIHFVAHHCHPFNKTIAHSGPPPHHTPCSVTFDVVLPCLHSQLVE